MRPPPERRALHHRQARPRRPPPDLGVAVRGRGRCVAHVLRARLLGRRVELGATLDDRVGHLLADELDRADRVVVRGDDHVDEIRIAVRVHHRDDRDLEAARLFDRDVLAVRVDDEERARRPLQLPHALEVPIEVLQLVLEPLGILLGQREEISALLALDELVQALDPLLDRDEVRQEPAQPALIDVMHVRPLRLFGDGFLGLLLRADEQDLPAVGREVADEGVRLLHPDEGLLKIDDVDPVALHEDEALHLRVPPPSLVPEVDTRFQELLHRDDGQCVLP